MLLAGCLSYSNSAMNPVLYAFLSENFKKSFLKACTCAKGREANAALQVENSAFPRKRTMGGSEMQKRHHQNRFNRGRDDGEAGGGHNPGGLGGRRGHHDDLDYVGGNARSGQALLTTTDDGCATGASTSHEMNDISTGITTVTSR